MKTPKKRFYHLYSRRADGTMRKLTGYPMVHHECVTMKSKFSPYSQARILFVEVPAPYFS